MLAKANSSTFIHGNEFIDRLHEKAKSQAQKFGILSPFEPTLFVKFSNSIRNFSTNATGKISEFFIPLHFFCYLSNHIFVVMMLIDVNRSRGFG
jgi:hypothetical protein